VPLTQKKDSFLSEPGLAVDMRVLRYEIQRNLPHSRYIRFQCRDSVAKLKEFFEDYHTCALEWLAHFARLVKFADKDDEIWRQTDRNMLLRMRAQMEQEIKESRVVLAASCEEDGVELVKAKFVDYTNRLLELQVLGMNDLVVAMCARLVKEALLVIEHLKQYEKKKETKVRVVKGDEICSVAYGSDQRPITRTHYMKLYTLYMLNTPQDEKVEHFQACLYVLLRRYQTFFGEINEGAAMHAAALPRVFQFLKRELGVEQEMFASPLNCYFARFNSAFPDIDIFFGSLGSFFDFHPTTGSFEVGPPYTEEVLQKMAEQLDALLEASQEPLSFVVFVPDWRDPISPGLLVLEASKFLRGDFVIKGRSYEYVIGHQHNEIVKKRYWKLPFDTHLYVLQNAAGSEKWPATPEFLQKFKDSLLGNVI
jgi:phosphorylated CTD-interacting factor 1